MQNSRSFHYIRYEKSFTPATGQPIPLESVAKTEKRENIRDSESGARK